MDFSKSFMDFWSNCNDRWKTSADDYDISRKRIARPHFSEDFREKTVYIAVELVLLDSKVLDLAFSFSFRVVSTLYRKRTGMQEKFLKIIC